MNTYPAYYKGDRVAFQLPADWTVIGVGEPRPTPPMKNLQAALRQALTHPVGTTSLQTLASKAQRAVIISDDQTRPTPAHQLIPGILNTLNDAGLPDARISVVVGRGTHRIPTDDEVKGKLGEETLSRVDVTIHDPDDNDGLTYLGVSARGTPIWINRTVAEADLTIGVGNVAPHYFAGYGGGGKIILPGVAGRETIIRNHVLMRDPHTTQGRLDGNVVYADMLDVARRAGLSIKLDVVLNTENRVAGLSAGEVGAEHRQAIDRFNTIYGFQPPRQADITITCGYPLETNLIQSTKAVLSADLTTKAGGIILLVSACYDGPGHGLYETLKEKPEPDEVIDWIAHGKSLPSGGPIASRTRAMLKTKTIAVVTDGVPHSQLKEMDMTPYATIPEAIRDLATTRKQAEVIVLPTGASINPLL
jgi:nickel-dependent lactate racemase